MRNNTVTYTKAIGIILMVLGHALYSTSVERFVGLFNMPLFFIMSGYCFKEKYLNDARTFITNKIKGIWKPFVIYSTLFLLLHNFFIKTGIYSTVSEPIYSTRDFITKGLNIYLRMMTGEPLISTFWFLKSLFWGSILFYIARRFLSRFVALSLLIASTVLLSYFNTGDPLFHINATDFMAASFIYIGCIAKDTKFSKTKRRFLAVLCLVIMVMATLRFRSNMLSFNAVDVLPYIITATSFCYIIYKLISHIHQSRLFDLIGNNTLDIMIWNFVCFLLISAVIGNIYHLPAKQYIVFPVIVSYSIKGWWIIYACTGIFLPISIKILIKKLELRISNGKE